MQFRHLPRAGEPIEIAEPRQHGAKALLWAILIDGLEAYCRGILTGATQSLLYREAETWIFAPYGNGVTSFASLCELFGINARQLRRRLIEFRENPRPEIFRFLNRNAA